MQWQDAKRIRSHGYTCGYCNHMVSTDKGYLLYETVQTHGRAWICICPHCNNPTYYRPPDNHVPSPPIGLPVKNLPDDVAAVYQEVRQATTVGAYTLAMLGARKLLMHIAVENGAAPNQSFVSYVTHITDNHMAPPKAQAWVDRIRTMGNDATHEIALTSAEEARTILAFVQMLLQFNYEYTDDALPAEPDIDPAG